MENRNQIVCGIDESAESLHAAEMATALALQLGAEPVLVTVVEDPDTIPYNGTSERERHRHRAMQEGAELFERLGITLLDDEAPERVVRLGDPAEVLPLVADERDALLLCVGSRGQGRLRAALLGSVSADVVRAGTRPVLVVSKAAEPDSVEDGPVLCGIDGSFGSLAAATVASGLAERLGAELIFLQARARDWGEPDHPFSRFREAASPHTKVRRIVTVAQPVEALRTVAAEERARLVVVGSRGLSPAQSVVLGSTSMELASSSRCPVVVVPEAVAAAELEAIAYGSTSPRRIA